METDHAPDNLNRSRPVWVRILAILILVSAAGGLGYWALRPGIVGPTPADAADPQSAGAAPTPDLSFGPEEASQLDLTLAPGIAVNIIPSARSLASARFDRFDISPAGEIFVTEGARLLDMTTGDDVFQSGDRVRSFAFVADTLAAIDANGSLGYYSDEGFQLVSKDLIAEPVLSPSSDRGRVFITRGTADHDLVSPALVSIRDGQAPEILTGSLDPIDAVGGDSFLTYYSVGAALFRLISRGEPRMLLILPEPDQTIVGIAAGGGAVYFSTRDAVYTIGDGLALPLVMGLGGQLRLSNGRLYVLSAEHGRVYSIILEQGKS